MLLHFAYHYAGFFEGKKFSLTTDDYKLEFVITGTPEREKLSKRLSRWIPEENLLWFVDRIVMTYGNYANMQSITDMAIQLPGMGQKEKHPVTSKIENLFNIIINLNDYHKWTREQIADWLETLDEIPTFDFPGEKKNAEKELFRITGLVKIKRIL